MYFHGNLIAIGYIFEFFLEFFHSHILILSQKSL